jgi:hypothetical protein
VVLAAPFIDITAAQMLVPTVEAAVTAVGPGEVEVVMTRGLHRAAAAANEGDLPRGRNSYAGLCEQRVPPA